MSAILTGSQVYGRPTEESDYDLVVHMAPEEAKELARIAKQFRSHPESSNYPQQTYRFGRLNLIVCDDDVWYKSWVDSREKCKQLLLEQRDALTREQAVEIHKQTRINRGLPE